MLACHDAVHENPGSIPATPFTDSGVDVVNVKDLLGSLTFATPTPLSGQCLAKILQQINSFNILIVSVLSNRAFQIGKET